MQTMETFRSAELGDIFNVLETDGGNNILDFDALNEVMFAFEEQHQLSINPYVYNTGTNPGFGVVSSAALMNPMVAPKVEPTDHSRSSNSDHMGETSDQTGGAHHHRHLNGSGSGNGGSGVHDVAQFLPGLLDGEEAGGGGGSRGGQKKKRTRNEEQMHLNRVAQQKYRERKKAEYNDLQSAVDQLAAQLAAFKALEHRTGALEQQNHGLQQAVAQQAQHIGQLEGQLSHQTATIAEQATRLTEAAAIANGQQKMILEQHTKLQLQEQVILALQDRLKVSIETAMQSIDEGTVCQKLIAAVKSALYGAKDVDGLQEVLEKLPDHLVVEICKNIFTACKEMWPELYQRCNTAGRCNVAAPHCVS